MLAFKVVDVDILMRSPSQHVFVERQIEAREHLPEGFQRSEFLLEHGMLDMIVERTRMRDVLGTCLEFMAPGMGRTGAPASDGVGA